jgi:hypothetical protein
MCYMSMYMYAERGRRPIHVYRPEYSSLPPLASHPHHHGILRLGHDHATDMHVPLTSPRHANRCLPCYADVVRLRHPPGSHAFDCYADVVRLRHPPGSHAFEARIELTSAGAVAGARIELTFAGAVAGAPLDSARTTAGASVGALLGAAVGMGLAAAEGGGLAAAEAGGLAAAEAGGRCWRKSGCCHDASCCRVTPALGMALGNGSPRRYASVSADATDAAGLATGGAHDDAAGLATGCDRMSYAG